MVKRIFLSLLHFYQKYISVLTPGSCRYYPTCSEYAKWRIENENIFKSIFFIIFRILRCNQLFKGGIEYPVVKVRKLESEKVRKLKNEKVRKLGNIKYWLVPAKKEGEFYIIKKIF